MRDISPTLAGLQERFGARYSASAATREQHGRGEAHHANAAPDAVIFARSTEEVAEIVARAAPRRACRSSPSAPARRWKATWQPCAAA